MRVKHLIAIGLISAVGLVGAIGEAYTRIMRDEPRIIYTTDETEGTNGSSIIDDYHRAYEGVRFQRISDESTFFGRLLGLDQQTVEDCIRYHHFSGRTVEECNPH